MVNFISQRTHERLHYTKERYLTVSNAPYPTLELETEPEHRLITLQLFTRTGTNHGPEGMSVCWLAQSGTNHGNIHHDDMDQPAIPNELQLDDDGLLQLHARRTVTVSGHLVTRRSTAESWRWGRWRRHHTYPVCSRQCNRSLKVVILKRPATLADDDLVGRSSSEPAAL